MRPPTYVIHFALALALTVGVATRSNAQSRVVKTPSAVLAAPRGSAVGSVHPGVELRVLETRGGYVKVSVSGFVERARLSAQRNSATRRVGNRSAIVRARAAAAASSVASFDAGTTVTVSDASAPKGWVKVSRTGWVLGAALAPAATPPAKLARAGKAAPRAASKTSAGEVAASVPAPSRPSRPSAAAAATTPAPAPRTPTIPAAPATTAVSAPLGDSALVPTANVALRAAPDARALATIAQGTTLVPLARERGWVRVRVEGWVPERDLAPADTAVRANVSAADLRADPQGSRGRVVRWSVQILARQTADPLRRDLAADEAYFLARGPYEENSLLYLVIPPSMLESAKSITTLTQAMVTARVRTGKSDLVGVPILDLLTITPHK